MSILKFIGDTSAPATPTSEPFDIDFCTARLYPARGVLWMLVRVFGGDIVRDADTRFPAMCASLEFVARMLTESVASAQGGGAPDHGGMPADVKAALTQGSGIARTLIDVLHDDGEQCASDEVMDELIGALDLCVDEAIAGLERLSLQRSACESTVA